MVPGCAPQHTIRSQARREHILHCFGFCCWWQFGFFFFLHSLEDKLEALLVHWMCVAHCVLRTHTCVHAVTRARYMYINRCTCTWCVCTRRVQNHCYVYTYQHTYMHMSQPLYVCRRPLMYCRPMCHYPLHVYACMYVHGYMYLCICIYVCRYT